jgi:nicotinamide riboside transporter PnuC
MLIIRYRRFSCVVFRLDYVSCVLTVISTILIGKRYWEGWVLAAVNSAVVCVIGFKTAQLGFIPANLFCIILYAFNLRSWRKTDTV